MLRRLWLLTITARFKLLYSKAAAKGWNRSPAQPLITSGEGSITSKATVGEKADILKLSHFPSSCLNFRLDVSFFVQLSHFSSSCLNFRLTVPIFVQMSHSSSSCLDEN
ncbi:hypothetical protein V9T40_011649 [Parthenolecanium corni]|uniref:Secreted protein n=1 Tax=Parthenolecanium corni TaxID=536013 RepID=A0AAN9T9R0_9HEMI